MTALVAVMSPLPAESTLFASTYRSAQELDGGKPYGTAIVAMYCDEPRSISLFHRLPVDEVWHFYDGSPLRLHIFSSTGSYSSPVLGRSGVRSGQFQHVVPRGSWFGAEVIGRGSFSLIGCTIAPVVLSVPPVSVLAAAPVEPGRVFTVSVPEGKGISLTVINSQGALVVSQAISAVESKVSLNHLAKGIYLVNIKTTEGTITRKVSVQ